jgi:hypothetical protein
MQSSNLCHPLYSAQPCDNTGLSTAEQVVKMVAMQQQSYEQVSICYEWVLHSVVHHGLSRQYSTARLTLHEMYCNT